MHKHYNEADEARISKAIDDFKESPVGWNEEKMGPAPAIKNAVLNRLLASIDRKQSRTIVFKKIMTAAASVVLVMGLVWLCLSYKNSFFAPANIIVKTKRNEVKKVLLSDGSIVWLNGNSTLSYPETFNEAKRKVDLIEGEAFFDIHHNAKQPFQVKAGKTLTNVLGTAFNISSYAWLNKISVTVARGKVAVNNALLLPNQQLLYTKASGKLERKNVTAAYVTSWMKRELSFNDEDFKTVAAKIEDKFNVKISFANRNMLRMRITAKFETTDNLNEILDALSMTMGLNYKVNNHHILITH